MRASDFDFKVPPELVAQTPASQRDASRLLVLHRNAGNLEHRRFPDLLDYLRAGDVLVLNNSRVIPARLRGENKGTGGQFELLLLEETSTNDWWAMLRPGKRAREGTEIRIKDVRGELSGISAQVTAKNAEGHGRVVFSGTEDILQCIETLGEVPLPPYIERLNRRELESDRNRYQTVFAHAPGSVAAPTAGLHFTEALLEKARGKGVETCFVTLHVGLGTFAPIKSEALKDHTMHEERVEISPETARLINRAKSEGRRIVGVGTTTLRVLEGRTSENGGGVEPGKARTRIFIYPPHQFKVVDALVTNFHLPRSTLVMLVSAFAAPGRTDGRDKILQAYAKAIEQRYRFFSYGDAMLIL
jgi:S-adenosylmethionine:tRNA ribosyltransferase-isomerase